MARALSLRSLACGVLVAALTVPAAGFAPQRGLNQVDGAPTGPRTGLIVGQVVDSTGAAVPEAIVQMSYAEILRGSADDPERPRDGGRGRAILFLRPAGRRLLHSSRPRKAMPAACTASAARMATVSACRSPKANGASDAKLTLWKYAVIGGTVLDEAGEPVIGVSVQALVKDVVAGARSTAPVNSTYLISDGHDRRSRHVPAVAVDAGAIRDRRALDTDDGAGGDAGPDQQRRRTAQRDVQGDTGDLAARPAAHACRSATSRC